MTTRPRTSGQAARPAATGRATARSAAGQAARPAATGDTCVLVVGMHRSGTSATAGLLVELGLAGPPPEDLVPASPSNERGHWESQALVTLNRRLVWAQGATPYGPPRTAPGWEHGRGMDELRAAALDEMGPMLRRRPSVWKDPRLCLTLPFWRTVLEPPVAAVLVLRDPVAVARSLARRDTIPVLLGLALWDRYVRTAAAGLRGLPTLVVSYEAMLEEPASWCNGLGDFLAAVGIGVDPGRRAAAVASIDASLRHQEPTADGYEPLAASHRQLLDALVAQAGPHRAWEPPALPPEPPWVEDVLAEHRQLDQSRRAYNQLRSTRAVRAARAIRHLTGSGAGRRPAPAPPAGDPSPTGTP